MRGKADSITEMAKLDVEGYDERDQPQHANSHRKRNALARPSTCLPLRIFVIISHDE
ncbi:hypothetical protein DSM14862_04097 (plasmid) [Sulfitobacter indolifex]|uniref:Uncharacterized protein n=1 Tax=Sulfitobacter indolifex HEL-45 TaxID=391624 RepID=A0ABM9X1Y9_9RHOB|nr:hypothetical protein [Sulfitobacter indolifex]EDQ03455.1 hypothetical protein OIHEL45_16811 [Sulfitobacter indolifex HEL-45]UOA21257.1 hypothetical protein DSM14862_04097 [Sulfitobacter indolifex]